MNSLWRRLARLAKQTGHPCFLFDPEGDDGFVLMPLSDYERHVGINKPGVTPEETDFITTDSQALEEDVAQETREPAGEIPVDLPAAKKDPMPAEADRFYLEPIE